MCNPISVQKYIPLFYLIGMCPLVIKCDLEYWGLDELLLEPCCALKYYPEVEICVKEIQSDEIAFKKTKVSETMSCKESKKNCLHLQMCPTHQNVAETLGEQLYLHFEICTLRFISK